MRTLLRMSWVVALAAVAVGVGLMSASGSEPYFHDAGAKARGNAGANVTPRSYAARVYREPTRTVVRNEATPPVVANKPTERRSFSYEPGTKDRCGAEERVTTKPPEVTRGTRSFSYEPATPTYTAPAYTMPLRRSYGRTNPGFYSRADSKSMGR